MMPRVAWISILVGLVACEKGGGDPAKEQAVVQAKDAPAPAPVAAVADAAASGCPPLVVAVKPDAVWIRSPKSQSVVAKCSGVIDGAAVAAELCATAKAAPPGCTAVEMAAEPGVAYQQIITVMDIALQVGLRDVSLTDPGSMSLALHVPPDPGDKVKPACGEPIPACPAPPPAPAAPAAPAAPVSPVPTAPGSSRRVTSIDIPLPSTTASRHALADAVVVVVPADGAVMVGGKAIAIAREASAGNRIEPLFQALRAKRDSAGAQPLVLQADQSVDARLVNRIISTANAAGYQDIMFAVSRKTP